MTASKELHEQIDHLSPREWLALLNFLKEQVEQGKSEYAPLLDVTQRFIAEQGYAGTIQKENPTP